MILVASQQVNLENCNEINLNIDQPSEKVAITSFPGSGNTWMRHLLHMSTGYHTGSFYHDGKLKDKGFLGEALNWDDDRVVGIKIHKMGLLKKTAQSRQQDMRDLISKAVLLIRSPYRAILSEFNRVNNPHHMHTGKAENEAFFNGTWDSFLNENIDKWENSITTWFNQFDRENLNRIHVVCYENLKEDTFGNMEKVLDFMNVNFTRPNCISHQNTEGSFKRESSSSNSDTNDHIRFFSSRQRTSLEDSIHVVQNYLRERGLEDCTQYF